MNRSQYLGGSDIPAILHLGFNTPLDVYLSKKESSDDVYNDQTWMGEQLESIIAQHFLLNKEDKQYDIS